MATYVELSDPYANVMINPAPLGPGICPTCRGFPGPGYAKDRGCGFNPDYLDAMAAISYEPMGGQLHTALRGYKDGATSSVRNRLTLVVASILWRFLVHHEDCIASAAGADAFDLVTTVASKTPANDDARSRLRDIVGRVCLPTADRYERVLLPVGDTSVGREFDPARFRVTRSVEGQAVLLIDDTWTTGSNVQSAAFALTEARAATVASVVVGRYVTTDYQDHAARLAALPRPFSWDHCALH